MSPGRRTSEQDEQDSSSASRRLHPRCFLPLLSHSLPFLLRLPRISFYPQAETHTCTITHTDALPPARPRLVACAVAVPAGPHQQPTTLAHTGAVLETGWPAAGPTEMNVATSDNTVEVPPDRVRCSEHPAGFGSPAARQRLARCTTSLR